MENKYITPAGDPQAEAKRIATNELKQALRGLIELHCDWEPGGRATRRFTDHNNAAIAKAEAALKAALAAGL